MTSPLISLQEDSTFKLESEAFFSILPVLSVRKLQIVPALNNKLIYLTEKGGKKGAGVMVGMPTIDVESPNAPGPLIEVRFPITVVESPIINLATGGSGQSAEDIAMTVLKTLHGFMFDDLCLLQGGKDAIQPNTAFENLVSYIVNLRGQIPQTAFVKCITPVISEAGLVVTLTNITAGATIYYTTDLSFPGSGNPAAQVYTDPFAVASGTVVRYAAEKENLTGSDTGKAFVS